MKVLLLFANSTVRQGKAFPDDLQALLQNEANKRGENIQFFTGYARSLSYLISNDRVKIRDHRNHMNLEDYDFVYFRKAGTAMQQMQTCAYYLRDRDVPFWDTELLKANSRNKLSQMMMLEREGLPIPPTLFCRNKTRLLRLITRRYADVFPFPIILKATGGSRGDANYLIHNQQELIDTVKRESSRSFMAQAYIPNDGDYRFFVAGGRLRGIISRKAPEGSHLSNTSVGGTSTLLPHDALGDETRTHAVQAAQVFGRDTAGVDIMFDSTTGKHYILEVNRAPQIERASFEKEKAEWMVTAIINAVANHQPYSVATEKDGKQYVGRFEYVKLTDSDEHNVRIIAKTDTGADSSSIHSQSITEQDGTLRFEVAGKAIVTDKYFIKRVRSSSGHLENRYFVTIPIYIGKKSYTLKTTLTDRSAMKNDMLLGRRFLREHNLIVDVSRRFVLSSANRKKGGKK